MDPSVNFYVPILLSILIALVGWAIAKINDMSARIRDLHVWHSPNDDGQQSWKNTRIDALCDKVDSLTNETHELITIVGTVFRAQSRTLP